MNKRTAAKGAGWLFVLFSLGLIGKATYCRLCDPKDPKCASTCAPNPEPTPTPTPTPPAECMPGVPWCDQLVPPAQCSSAAQSCKHNPTSDPNHCELAPPCPVEPTPTPGPTHTPTPPPGQGCSINGEPGPFLNNYTNKLGNDVNLAIRVLMPNCEIGARCVVTIRPQAFQAAVEAQLRKQGFCSGQHAPDTDEIAVATSPTAPREGFHIYSGAGWDDPSANGTVVWAPNAARGAYAAPDTPVNDYGCPPPRPDRVWTADTLPPGWGQDQIGQPRWRLGSSPHGAWIDTTATTIRNEPYCHAIGMSPDANGVPRAGCPMRPEGNPDRVACERYVAEGDWIVAGDDGKPCEQNPDNSAQFRARDGQCRLCNPAKTVCTEAY